MDEPLARITKKKKRRYVIRTKNERRAISAGPMIDIRIIKLYVHSS